MFDGIAIEGIRNVYVRKSRMDMEGDASAKYAFTFERI